MTKHMSDGYAGEYWVDGDRDDSQPTEPPVPAGNKGAIVKWVAFGLGAVLVGVLVVDRAANANDAETKYPDSFIQLCKPEPQKVEADKDLGTSYQLLKAKNRDWRKYPTPLVQAALRYMDEQGQAEDQDHHQALSDLQEVDTPVLAECPPVEGE